MLLLISFDGVHYGDLNLTKLPNISRLIENGTYTKRLETVFPSVTWNIHTSVVTGEMPSIHRIYGNSIYSRTLCRKSSYFKTELGSKDQLMAAPTIYDALTEKGLRVASICWPLTQSAPSIALNIPEFYTQEEFDNACSGEFYNELIQHGFPMHRYGDWSANHLLNPMQDELTESIIEYIVRNKKADVVFGHFLLYDSMQHDFGVRSPEALWSLRYVDGLIGRLLETLEENGILEESNIILFSDHGHTDVKRNFLANEELTILDSSIPPFIIVNNGGAVFLYRTDDHSDEDLKKTAEAYKRCEAVERVYYADNFGEVGWSLPTQNDCLFPDLVLALKEGWCGAGDSEQKVIRSIHGYNPQTVERMNGFMVCSGSRFQSGVIQESAHVTDIFRLIEQVFKN